MLLNNILFAVDRRQAFTDGTSSVSPLLTYIEPTANNILFASCVKRLQALIQPGVTANNILFAADWLQAFTDAANTYRQRIIYYSLRQAIAGVNTEVYK